MIIEALKHIQARDDLTDQKFAEKLGIHRISWNRIKTGRVPFGKKFLSGVRQAYPELKDAIDIFLSGDATLNSQIDTQGISTEPHETPQGKRQGGLGKLLRGLVAGLQNFKARHFTR